jgi:hypothetical protein
VAPVALRDRTQLTFTGNVYASAISADGKQLAFITHDCKQGRCGYAVDVQDVGGTSTHRILDGATAAYGLEWSPDRRNLIFVGTLGRRWGFYLLSASAGRRASSPRAPRCSTRAATRCSFAPPLTNLDSVFQIKVASLEGTIRDSIRVAGMGSGINGLSVSPGGKWIVALIVQKGRGFWQVFDRSGKVADQVLNSCTCPGRITADALWLTRSGTGFESIVRLAIDPATGKLATRQDTLLSGGFNSFSVTADGTTLVVDDGTSDYSLWAANGKDALQGKFPAEPLLRSSTRINGQLSPDGALVLVRRNLPSPSGRTEPRFSIIPFAGGAERPLDAKGTPRGAFWVDSATVAIGGQSATGMHLSLLDARTGAPGRSLDLPDSLVQSVAVLPDGWAWIPRHERPGAGAARREDPGDPRPQVVREHLRPEGGPRRHAPRDDGLERQHLRHARRRGGSGGRRDAGDLGSPARRAGRVALPRRRQPALRALGYAGNGPVLPRARPRLDGAPGLGAPQRRGRHVLRRPVADGGARGGAPRRRVHEQAGAAIALSPKPT